MLKFRFRPQELIVVTLPVNLDEFPRVLAEFHMSRNIETRGRDKPTLPPQRTTEHGIDTDAVRVVQGLLTRDWVTRSTDDRDYGIDMLLEYFDCGQPTGIMVLLQIKGTDASFDAGPTTLAAPVKTLIYARMFQAPFLLVHASNADKKAYFIWVQKYIDTRLTEESPRWDKQKSITVTFPKENALNSVGLAKILGFAKEAGYRDLGFTFMRHLNWFAQYVKDFRDSHRKDALQEALARLKEIARLQPFLANYEETCEYLDLDELARVLKKAKAFGEFDHGDDKIVDQNLSDLFDIELRFLDKDEGGLLMEDSFDEGYPY